MFDALNGFDDAAALSDALKARVAKYYGTPLTAFLIALCEPDNRHGWSAILRRTLEGFIAKSLPASASGQAQRAAPGVSCRIAQANAPCKACWRYNDSYHLKQPALVGCLDHCKE